ncbi:hypothetical protein [Pontibacter virosus]|uniref:Uncharacterized protein n=1 Tax=Pontibacter virosus TaxID=1765052 RepID=A0A2U1B672_9BACT|nr:hypothetical protein [Pontibacter virosus]PVY44186.1 hypothetical protein C8E01_101552 [Pontibacter virosus]
MSRFNNLSEAVSVMRARGFVNTFSIQHQQVYCSELSKAISPTQLTLLERHAVPSPSAHNGEEEVYGFRTDDNQFGIMTNIYAEYDPEGFYTVFRQCLKGQAGHA